jgi:hypothetical protein
MTFIEICERYAATEALPESQRTIAVLVPKPQSARILELVVTDQFRIRLLYRSPRSCVEFVWEDADGNRNGNAFGVEISMFRPERFINSIHQRCLHCLRLSK